MLIAFDSETELIPDRTAHALAKTSPYRTPRLVVGTWTPSDKATNGIMPAQYFDNQVRAWLREGHRLVGHNVAFDVDVLCTRFPDLHAPFMDAYDAGRIHDTSYLAMLVLLAEGHYDLPDPAANYARPQMKRPSLNWCARHFLGRELDKGEEVRLTFGQYLRPDGTVHLEDLTPRHVSYAKQDAEATLELWHELVRRAEEAGHASVLRNEPLQARAAWVAHQMDKTGIAIDRAEARRLRDLFERDIEPLQHDLVEHGLGEWRHKPGTIVREKIPLTARDVVPLVGSKWSKEGDKLVRLLRFKKHCRAEQADPEFHLLQGTVRSRLADLPEAAQVGTTPTGLQRISADDWADLVPADRPDLETWLAHEKLKKILNTYLGLYSEIDEVYPRIHVLGARSGRMSSSAPNAQNVPKRRHGIRSLFVPRKGHVFVKADFSYQELVTLAEGLFRLGIHGPLADVIRSGDDPHYSTAARMLQKPVDEITRDERQAAKALNFGLPGGLGPRKLADYARKTYGVVMTPDEAREARDLWFEAYPDVAEFLRRHNRNLHRELLRVTGHGLQHWYDRLRCSSPRTLRAVMAEHLDPEVRAVHTALEHAHTVHLPTGRIRGKTTYTAACNSVFQGIASDVTKHALWLCRRAGLCVVLVVHDEIVVEVPDVTGNPQELPDYSVEEAAQLLERCMLDAFREICPEFGPYAKVEVSGPLDRWGPATSGTGELLDSPAQ